MKLTVFPIPVSVPMGPTASAPLLAEMCMTVEYIRSRQVSEANLRGVGLGLGLQESLLGSSQLRKCQTVTNLGLSCVIGRDLYLVD
jgi:hypothetical protein